MCVCATTVGNRVCTAEEAFSYLNVELFYLILVAVYVLVIFRYEPRFLYARARF